MTYGLRVLRVVLGFHVHLAYFTPGLVVLPISAPISFVLVRYVPMSTAPIMYHLRTEVERGYARCSLGFKLRVVKLLYIARLVHLKPPKLHLT